MTWNIVQADAIDFLRAQPADSLDLVFGSPPYEQARLYLEAGQNLGVSRKTDVWVAWMVEVYKAATVACNGLVAFVVAGQTRNFKWSAGPALLAADLHRAGLCLRNPPIFHRVGIPGSGGPDWLRADYEWIICTARPGKLPWSDNTASGHPPKWAPGGAMSYRNAEGERKNARGYSGIGNAERKQVHRLRVKGGSPKDGIRNAAEKGWAPPGHKNGDAADTEQGYAPPVLANPGNNIERAYTAAEVAAMMAVYEKGDWQHYNVGGGVMGGDQYSSQNEAPYPEALCDFFIRSFSPPDGMVCDPFSGSGTTAAVAVRNRRNFTGCDLRQSQVDLGRRRVEQETPQGIFAE